MNPPLNPSLPTSLPVINRSLPTSLAHLNLPKKNPNKTPSKRPTQTPPSTTVYIENLPSHWNARDIFNLLSRFNCVLDVFIPWKKNKKGVRFGFIRTDSINAASDIIHKFSNVCIGSCLLKLNFARFDRGQRNRRPLPKPLMHKPKTHKTWKASMRDTRSYASVTRPHNNVGNIEAAPAVREKVKTKVNEHGIDMVFDNINLIPNWIHDSLIGTLHKPESITDLHEQFAAEGVMNCQVRALGASLVLLSFPDNSAKASFLLKGLVWLNKWFSRLKVWEQTDVASERLVWIRCQGIPLHVWQVSFFSNIAGLFGKFLTLDENTSEMNRVDVARILISTKSVEFINKSIRVKVLDQIFRIGITEEPNNDQLIQNWSVGLGVNLIDPHVFTDVDHVSDTAVSSFAGVAKAKLSTGSYTMQAAQSPTSDARISNTVGDISNFKDDSQAFLHSSTHSPNLQMYSNYQSKTSNLSNHVDVDLRPNLPNTPIKPSTNSPPLTEPTNSPLNNPTSLTYPQPPLGIETSLPPLNNIASVPPPPPLKKPRRRSISVNALLAHAGKTKAGKGSKKVLHTIMGDPSRETTDFSISSSNIRQRNKLLRSEQNSPVMPNDNEAARHKEVVHTWTVGQKLGIFFDKEKAMVFDRLTEMDTEEEAAWLKQQEEPGGIQE